jgi:RND superfamily putative drug exporter
VLSVLGPRINRLSVPVLRPRPFGQGTWHRIAVGVMRRPLLVLLPTVAVLLAAGSPFLHIHLANTDVTQLPPDAEARRGAELLASAFPTHGANVIDVVVDFHSGTPLSPENIAIAKALSQRLRGIPEVAAVRSYVDVDPNLSVTAYQQLYAGPVSSLAAAERDEVVYSVGRSIAVITAVTPALPASDRPTRWCAPSAPRMRSTVRRWWSPVTRHSTSTSSTTS